MLTLNKKNIKRAIKPSRLIFLIVLLASNTLAWFIYATKIDNSVSVHVRAWNVVFEAGENEVTDTINVNVDSIYPGMSTYTYQIKAYNRSEVSASLNYQILSASILGNQYVAKEYKEMLGQPTTNEDMTAADIENMLASSYPFSITIAVSNATISQGTGMETYTLSVVWPYESGSDSTDTFWGVNSYQYKESNPNSPSITLNIKIIITQNPS